MITAFTPIAEPLLTDVGNRYLSSMNIDPLRGSVQLRLVTNKPVDNNAILMTMENVAYSQAACSPDDIEASDSYMFIAEFKLYSFEDGGAAVLAELDYPILNLDGTIRSAPGILHYYLHVDGDVCGDFVFGNFRLQKEVRIT